MHISPAHSTTEAPGGGRRLAVAAGLSLIAHAALAVVVGAEWPVGGAAGGGFERSPQAEDDEIDLGIERSDAVTVTWLGFEEPEPVSAPRAEVDQASMTRNPVGEPVPMVDPAVSSAAAAESAPMQEQSAQAELAEQGFDVPVVEDGAADIALPGDEPVEEVADRPSEQAAESETESKPSETEPADGVSSSEGDRRAEPRPAEGLDGEAADRDSPATSTEPVLEYTRGQPVAREGLEVLPKYFPIWQSLVLSTNPRNPLVRFTFDSKGRAKLVGFVIVENVRQNTGSEEFDQVLLTGLYNWTAKGAAIDELEEDGTVSVSIRMKLR